MDDFHGSIRAQGAARQPDFTVAPLADLAQELVIGDFRMFVIGWHGLLAGE
jgi:hypothetical protein